MEKEIRYQYQIEYRWGREVIIYAANQDDAFAQAKKAIEADGNDIYDPTGKVAFMPIKVEGYENWTWKQWNDEYEKQDNK